MSSIYEFHCLNAKLLHASFTFFDFQTYPSHSFNGIDLQVKLVVKDSLLRNTGNIFTPYSEIFLSECIGYSTSCMIDCIIKLFCSFDCFNHLPTHAGSQPHGLILNRKISFCL